MGKKKSFIDKKNSSTYHVVRRSMRDVGHIDENGEVTEVPSDFVLMPSPRNSAATNDIVLGSGGSAVSAATSSSSGAAMTKTAQERSKEMDGVMRPKGSSMSKLQQKIASAGLLEDKYDYEMHLKPITGSGIFFSGDTGHVTSATNDARARDRPIIENDVNEVSRQLDSIALTPDCMDDDIAQALFGDFDEGNFEEILDDFCITADMEPEQDADGEAGVDGDGDDAAFDYDEHIRGLIEKAEKAAKGEGFGPNAIPENHPAWTASSHEFGGAKPLHLRGINEEDEDKEHDVYSLDREFDGDGEYYVEEEYDQDYDGAPGVVSSLPPDQERALREKFEQTLAEYDSDDVGDLDEECDDIRGDVEFDDNPQLEAAFDDFLREKKDEIFIEGTKHLPENKRVGGSGYAALVDGKMVRADDLADASKQDIDDEEAKVEAAAQFEQDLADAEEILANPEMEPAPFEDVLIDGKSYFSERHRNPFDCESILTTYSNLDNNPAVIARSGRRNGKNKNGPCAKGGHDLPEEEQVHFMLSKKTGLPLGVLGKEISDEEEDEWNDGTFMSVNKGEARAKNETKAEKKARKNAVKEERRIARVQKKMMKEAFAEEFDRRAEAACDNDLAGKSVYRIA